MADKYMMPCRIVLYENTENDTDETSKKAIKAENNNKKRRFAMLTPIYDQFIPSL